MYLAISVFPTQSSSLLDQLNKTLEAPHDKLHVNIITELQQDELSALAVFLNQHPEYPLKKLSLKLNPSNLRSDIFLKLIAELNTRLPLLELVFTQASLIEQATDITDYLTNKLALAAYFPIQVKELENEGIVPCKLELQEFQNKIIANIHSGVPETAVAKYSIASNNTIEKTHAGSIGKPIHLKTLIKNKEINSGNLEKWTEVEIVQVHQVEQQINAEQVIEQDIQAELQEVQNYNGITINFERFKTDYLNYIKTIVHDEANIESLLGTLRHEMFTHYPCGIQFLSPAAAEQIALCLPALVTFNMNNLPNGFFIQKTDKGERVLDYDAYLESKNDNPFKPAHFVPGNEIRPIYEIELSEQDLRQWINDESLFQSICMVGGKYKTPAPLINLWIKKGDKGVIEFFDLLQKKTSNELRSFIYKHYLSYLPQWDHLLENEEFFSSLNRIQHYPALKCQCLYEFLQHCGSSRYDLNHTINTFEVFWNAWLNVCESLHIAPEKILCGWTSPQNGNPVVHMERLLFILTHARDLADQLDLLKGVCLDHYGAYYAVKYEGFTSVSPDMNLHYKINDDIIFNREFSPYRLTLDQLINTLFVAKHKYFNQGVEEEYKKNYWLIQKEADLSKGLNELINEGLAQPFDIKKASSSYKIYFHSQKEGLQFAGTQLLQARSFRELCYRFLGLQSSGITVGDFKRKIHKYIDYNNSVSFEREYLLIVLLFFTSHERYTGNINFSTLMESIDRASEQIQTFNETIHKLNELYKSDIKLNDEEGNNLFLAIYQMHPERLVRPGMKNYYAIANNSKNWWDYDDSIPKEFKLQQTDFCLDYIRKLFHLLEQNKHAVYKMLKVDHRTSVEINYAIDTAEYLAEDLVIKTVYSDILLAFSKSLRYFKHSVYYHDRQDEHIDNIKKSLDRLKYFFNKAGSQQKPNNLHHAIYLMIKNDEIFSLECCLDAFASIELLEVLDTNQVEQILNNNYFNLEERSHKNKLESFHDSDYDVVEPAKTSFFLPDIPLTKAVKKENSELKTAIVKFIIEFVTFVHKKSISESTAAQLDTPSSVPTADQLYSQPIHRLLKKIDEIRYMGIPEDVWHIFQEKLIAIRNQTLQSGFSHRLDKAWTVIAEKMIRLPDFQKQEFASLNDHYIDAKKISDLLSTISNNEFVRENHSELIRLFTQINYSTVRYNDLYAILNLFAQMPQRNYLALLKSILSHPQFIYNQSLDVNKLVSHLFHLHSAAFPSPYMLKCFELAISSHESDMAFSVFITKISEVYALNNHDPILESILSRNSGVEINYEECANIIHYTHGINTQRDRLSKIFLELKKHDQLKAFFDALSCCPEVTQKTILTILGKSQPIHIVNQPSFRYDQLIDFFSYLKSDELDLLSQFCDITPMNLPGLMLALSKHDKDQDFQTFLSQFELAPFGERPQSQFDLSHVEHVINHLYDLLNDSIYPYAYRKSLMEKFLLINAIGDDLPVFNKKPVKLLSNAELRTIFHQLQCHDTKPFNQLAKLDRQVLSLAIMREAMYRCTGQFPYSTQMITILHNAMIGGRHVSGVNTGQGKSLIDTMNTALLWLESGFSDLYTSSLVDAARDSDYYLQPFCKLLNIPFSGSPITASSPVKDYKENGINISTPSDLSLFRLKELIRNKNHRIPNSVFNEIDFYILDDPTSYKLALLDASMIDFHSEWIYYAINEFVGKPDFLSSQTSTKQDIENLKSYLKIRANDFGQSSYIVNKFEDAQWITLIESSLIVNYILKENVHYIIPENFKAVSKNGIELQSKYIQVLMKNGKPSPDASYGNSMQQLLYAHLNKKLGTKAFILSPAYKTIISSHFSNLIDQCEEVIGSTATPGSKYEMGIQHTKHGLGFSKMEPHQENQVKEFIPEVYENEECQFSALITQITVDSPHAKSAPNLIFCKDINTAKRFFHLLQKLNHKHFPIQLYTGHDGENEKEYIQRAAQPGMITVTTLAFGRNTDIHYDPKIGLNVWHTIIDFLRAMLQKSGRTGRQGSPGEVHYLLNKQDLNQEDITNLQQVIKEIQDGLDKSSEIQRKYNEELFSIIGYFLRKIQEIDPAKFQKPIPDFYLNAWHQFSKKCDDEFKESKRTGVEKFEYVKKMTGFFNELLDQEIYQAEHITFEQVLESIEKSYSFNEPYYASKDHVRISDCQMPTKIIYQLLDSSQTESPSSTIHDIKSQLSLWFDQSNKDTMNEKIKKYFTFILNQSFNQQIVASAHREFLIDLFGKYQFLLELFATLPKETSEDFVNLRNTTFYNMINHSESISLIKAITNIQDEALIDLEFIKAMMLKMLREFCMTSSFSNTEEWNTEKPISTLCTAIQESNNEEAVFQQLITTLTVRAAQDNSIECDRLKKDEFQSLLNNLIALMSALYPKLEMTPLIDALKSILANKADITDINLDNPDELERVKLEESETRQLIDDLDNAYSIKLSQLNNPSCLFSHNNHPKHHEPDMTQKSCLIKTFG